MHGRDGSRPWRSCSGLRAPSARKRSGHRPRISTADGKTNGETRSGKVSSPASMRRRCGAFSRFLPKLIRGFLHDSPPCLSVRLERGDLPLDLLLAQRESFLLHRPESDTDLQGDKSTVDRLGAPGGAVRCCGRSAPGMLENETSDNLLRHVRKIDDAGPFASFLRPPGKQSGAWKDRRAVSQWPGTPPPGHPSPRRKSASSRKVDSECGQRVRRTPRA